MKASTLAILTLVACGGAKATPRTDVPLPEPQQAKTYPIHLHRASHVGGRTHVVLDEDDDRKTTTTGRDGKVMEKKVDKVLVHFDAISTVTAVDEKKDASAITYDVTELTSAGKSIFRGKVELKRARVESDATLLANGAPPEKEVTDALKAVLSLRIGGPSDDEIFGSPEPHVVGARWAINGKLAQDDLASEEGMKSAAADGEATLSAVTRVGNLECLEVHSDIRMSGIELSKLPEGAVVEAGDMSAAFSGVFPTDDAIERLEDHIVFRLNLKIRMPAQGLVIVSNGTSRKDGHYSAL